MRRPLTVALVTLGDPGRLTGGYLYHRRVAGLASRFDARVAFVSFPERPFPLGAIDAPAVLQRVRRLGADAILLDSIAAAFLGPWLAAASPPVPLLGMLHQPPGGIDHGPPRSTVRSTLDRLAYRRARVLLVASESLANELVAGGISRRRIVLAPPGRDVAPGAGEPPGDLRRGRRVALLCVGNWVRRKGIHSLLAALVRLPQDAATLHLVGDDRAEPDYAERLHARLRRSDLAERVVVHGPRSIGEVAAFYAAADAFVLPSVKEPYGTVYGEAMAAGLPVIGWRAGNLPYLAEHEREGLLVTPGDLDGLAAAMLRLVEDEPLRERLGAAARARSLTRPTWEETAGTIFRTIREVVEQPPSAV